MGMTLDILHQLEAISVEAGEIARSVRQAHRLETTTKSDGSLVTEADRQVEAFLRSVLPDLVPGTTVWGEEEGYREPGEHGLWAVDPVDGTTNFAFGSHFWGVSIGLIQGPEITLGAIRLPDLHQTYSAGLGLGAFVDGEPLAPLRSGPIQPHEMVSYSDDLMIRYGHQLPGKMRYMGAWVMEAAMVFDGVFRGAVSMKASLYDVAASLVVCREMGGEVRYLDGSPFEIAPVLGTRGLGKPMLLFPAGTDFTLPV